MEQASVVVEGASKTYRLYASPWQRLAELVLRRRRHRPFSALRDIALELGPGDRLGVVGENGAGKSTLLKILAGVTTPSSGRVEVRGRVASILELGSGLHPELSGRQNVSLNAAMLGLSRADLDRRFEDIVAFSELGHFIDQPVKSYSTGMAMRLAFSIATQADPDVLIIDEALSVGDGYFQKKCMDRILELADERRILLFCSHAMYYVTSFCTQALWLRGGVAEAYGPVLDVVRDYETFLQNKNAPQRSSARPVQREAARIVAVEQRGEGPRSPGGWGVVVDWKSSSAERSFHLAVAVDRTDGVQLCTFATHQDGHAAFTGAERYRVELEVPELPVLQGSFVLQVYLLDGDGLQIFDRREIADAFTVDSPEYRVGIVDVPHRWEPGTVS